MANETFKRFDAADYLRTEDDIVAYLDAVAKHADAGAMALALAAVARSGSRQVRLPQQSGER